MIGDRAYDSDPLDQRIRQTLRRATHRASQFVARREPRRRTAALCAATGGAGKSNVCSLGCIIFVALVIRWEYYPENFLGMVQLACAVILLRHL